MLLLFMFLLFVTNTSFAAENKSIIPGRSIGNIPLTIQPDEIVTQLGHPDSVESSGDLLTVGFKQSGLMFVYTKPANLLFIITFNPAYKDFFNLGVDSSTKAVLERYGKEYKLIEQGQLVTFLYLEKGIGFTFDKGKVLSVWVFPGKEKTIDT